MKNMTLGGARKPVITITDADLRENGGQYTLMGGAALNVNYVELADLDRKLEGGPATAIYPVTEEQIAAGRFKLMAGPMLPVCEMTTRGVESHVAIPVLLGGGGGAAWDPSQPTGGGASPEHWYRADGPLWQDAGVTPAVLDAAVVGRWEDLTANADHVNQATAGFRPTLRLNVLNGHPVIRFDGVDDFLRGAFTNGGALAQPITMLAVAQLDAGAVNDGVNHVILDDNDTPSTFKNYSRGAGIPDDWAIYFGAGAALTGSASNSNWNIWTTLANGAASRFWHNGIAECAAGNAGGAGLSGITLGSKGHPAGEYWEGDIAEIIIYDSDLSDADKNQVGNYLAARYGLVYADIV